MDLPPDFRDLLEAFARESVEAVLVGGYAVAFHGRPRATKDIDLVLAGDPENLARAARALAAFGAPANVIGAIRTLAEGEVVYLGQPPLRIDLLRTIAGVSEAELFDRAISTSLDGQPLRVIALEHLIANKRAVARPQDLIDADLLEAVTRRAR
ncbi:MAG: nucleotidyltransferase [Sandaracinaceae bacterium]|nr:nucleotidyltransferase [Sandaracinaceae bacterium]